MSDQVMVVGGGIAGIQAALDMAKAGTKVVLVERSCSIGGKMAALDKNFPTLDCSICIEAPIISEAMQNKNIEVITLAEVEGVEGQAGDFTVTLKQRARYVTDECTRCDECVAVCPEVRANEFDVGMGARKAIYTPFAQAEPGAYAIDIDACLNDPPNYLPCDRCVEACKPACIDFSMKPVQRVRKNVASIIVATGFDMLDPRVLPEYGYGKHPDVLTSMELERLLNAAGPTAGDVIKPSNGKHPESLLFVLCVGSRDQRYCAYCSRVCCMYSIKESVQAIDHGIPKVTTLYMDIRAYGKGFDEFHERSRSEGVEYIRGRPSEVRPAGDDLVVRFENTDEGRVEERTFDMVVLAPALIPSAGTPALAEALGIELDEDGFIKTLDVSGSQVATTRPGIYACGCATGPKDIPDSVASGSGAGSMAMTHIEARSWPEEEEVEALDMSGEARVGVFLCDCGSNIAGTVDVPAVAEWAETIPGVEHSEELMFACAGTTQEHITEVIKEKGLNRAVVAACSPKTHNPTFQRACIKAGLNQYLLEMANVRNHDSWVHKKEREAATVKARDLVKMAVEKSKYLQPLEAIPQSVVQKALVVGGGIAGMAAATNLAQQGFETHLVEAKDRLGGMLNELGWLAGVNRNAREVVEDWRRALARAGVRVHLDTKVETISGFIGSYSASLTDGETMDVGAVILATGAVPHVPETFDYGKDPRVITNLDLEKRFDDIEEDRITFISCVGSRNEKFGCSRYCCQTMVDQALRLREKGKKVRVLYRDMRTYSRHAEEMYEEACRKGVQFFQYDEDSTPEEAVRFEDGNVILHDELIGREVAIPSDLVVLVVGLRPPDEDGIGVAKQLKVSIGEDGFLLESHPKLGPVEAAVQGVFMAGTAQGPKDILESVAQGLATAAKASSILARDVIEQEPLTAVIDEEACTGCTLCAKVCPYSAIQGKVKEPHRVITAACTGCGTCAAACPVDAITMPGFTDEQILAQIDAATEENPEEKVVVFACNWCSYAGADQAGIAKYQYPPSSRIIRTMCSGRISDKHIMRAFERGAGAVLVSGCHIGDCHYITANHETLKRFPKWRARVKAKGYDPERLQLEWFTAAEGKKFSGKMKELDDLVRGVPSAEGAPGEAKLEADGGGEG
jgi:heterodisulfide reductase subunit A